MVFVRKLDLKEKIPERIIKGQEFKMRVVAYNPKTIQIVRNLQGFEAYHLANPGTLKHILAQTTIISMQKDLAIDGTVRYGNSHKANLPYPRPQYILDTQFMHLQDNNTRVANAPRAYSEVPWSHIVEASIRWLKGLIMQAYGAEGLDVIKEAQNDALAHFKLKTE